MTDWQPASTAPNGKWVRTKRDGEDGENVCAIRREGPIGTTLGCSRHLYEDEWIERATGVTTVTHSTFLPPTHWKPLDAYCCGFLFGMGEDDGRVVLVRKNRPAWQAGSLNGVGGSIEAGETPVQAMRREFKEETGVEISDWKPLVLLEGSRGWDVHFFYTHYNRLSEIFTGAQSLTDEKISIRTVKIVLDDPSLIPNLRWLLPLALDESGVVKPIKVKDHGKV